MVCPLKRIEVVEVHNFPVHGRILVWISSLSGLGYTTCDLHELAPLLSIWEERVSTMEKCLREDDPLGNAIQRSPSMGRSDIVWVDTNTLFALRTWMACVHSYALTQNMTWDPTWDPVRTWCHHGRWLLRINDWAWQYHQHHCMPKKGRKHIYNRQN